MLDLDTISEKILKQIIKYNNSLTNTQLKTLKALKNYSTNEIADCLSNLNSLGYISLDEKRFILSITFKGKQYFLLKKQYLARTVLINLLLPLIVSLITTLLTLSLSK